MKYKILVLDLDGTLTNKKKEITVHTRETLIRAQEAGVKIVLASGRPTYGIAPLAEELRLGDFEGYILSYNGGQIIDWKTKKMMYENELDPKVYPYLYECAKKNGFVILSYKDEYIVSEDAGNPYVQHEAFLNRMPSITVPNFLEVFDFPVPKCLIVGDPEPLSVLEQKMKQDLEGRMNVFRSEPYFLEVVGSRVDKANTLGVIMEMEGIKTDEIVVFGDGVADVTMLQLADLGIAMGNAPDSVKRCADYVTLSNNEDGVAVAVENAFLAEVRESEIPLDAFPCPEQLGAVTLGEPGPAGVLELIGADYGDGELGHTIYLCFP